jgi:hypothetical protein
MTGGGEPVAGLDALIYDVAIAPERYGELVEAWEARVRVARPAALAVGRRLEVSMLEAEARRGERILEVARGDAPGDAGPRPERAREAALAELPAMPALAVAADLSVPRANPAARALPGAGAGRDAVVARLGGALAQALAEPAPGQPRPSLLRAGWPDGRDRPSWVEPLAGPGPAHLVVAADPVWTDALGRRLAEAADLSLAEIALVRGLVGGRASGASPSAADGRSRRCAGSCARSWPSSASRARASSCASAPCRRAWPPPAGTPPRRPRRCGAKPRRIGCGGRSGTCRMAGDPVGRACVWLSCS